MLCLLLGNKIPNAYCERTKYGTRILFNLESRNISYLTNISNLLANYGLLDSASYVQRIDGRPYRLLRLKTLISPSFNFLYDMFFSLQVPHLKSIPLSLDLGEALTPFAIEFLRTYASNRVNPGPLVYGKLSDKEALEF